MMNSFDPVGAEIQVLGPFTPSRLQSEVIEAEVRALLPACCRCERIGIRTPQGVVPNPDNLQWHQDGGGAAGTTKHMVIWASQEPTDLRDSSGTIFPAEPYTLIWFDNTKAFHKQPTGTDEAARWFLAVRCSGELF